MASSSSPASQRRTPHRKRQALSRSNSSFLGTIKNLVTAPLAWFATTGDFEDSKDFTGKRRRLPGAPIEPIAEVDDRTTRNKRMRVQSPPQDESPSEFPSHHGYLDPPGSLFHHQENRQPSPYNPPPSARLLSTAQNYDFFDNNSNLNRASTLSRTMSIDPPSRPLSSTSAIASIPLTRDTSMDSSSFIRNAPRDMSMPPLSGRPTFRMRTSMTPQPLPPREVSEPPPLNTLVSNPTFVRAPLIKASQSMRGGLSRQSSVTLGTLAETVRTARSPVRQHSSLLFGSSGERVSYSPRPESAIEKALHELDIYKTPLVPTRLRSSHVPSASSSDLFKSRRASHLVLMQHDKHTNRLGRRVSGPPVVNGTKPYAGEGGMKKLLARRKKEADDADDDHLQRNEKNHMDGGVQKPDAKTARPVEPKPVPDVPPPPPPTKADWFSTNAGSGAGTSSLRVGRTKVRNHIARPARPSKTTFSAAYEDDDFMDAEELNPEAVERKQEREALEEAAKRAPIFQIPEGFSFAKETKPVELDTTNAKEPPIASLPFSFAKLAPARAKPTQQQTPDFAPAVSSPATSTFSHSFQLLSAPAAAHSPLTLPAPQRAPSPSPQAQPIVASAPPPPPPRPPVATVHARATPSASIPNFFASSSLLAKPLDMPKAAPLIFTPPSATQAPSINFTLPTPLKDADNPLWEGESKKEGKAPINSLFSGFGGPATEKAPLQSSTFNGSSTSAFPSASVPTPSISIFGATLKKDEPEPAPAQPTLLGGTPATPATFSLGYPAVSTPSSLFSGDTPKATSPFGDLSAATAPVPLLSAPKPLLGEPPKLTSPAPETAFGGATLKPPSLSSEPPKPAPSASAPFSFGQPRAAAPSTSSATNPLFGVPVEVPKPLFGGGSGGFSFDALIASREAEKPVSTAFAFGAAPSTPVPADKKSLPFSFGAPAPAPALIGFSFSGGGSPVGDVSSKPFTFGQLATIARPETPPKSQEQEQEVSMEESPNRDLQQTNKLVDTPTIGGGPFAFGSSSAGASTFGAQNNGSSLPSGFGPSSSASNPFAKDNKLAENKPFGGGFGQPVPSPAFNFGQTKQDEPPRPSSTESFAFGSMSTSAMVPSAPFSFGGSSNNSTGSALGQSQAGSAPGSPSTFNQHQPSPFTFGAPLPPVNTAFSFNSQPASPAGGNAASLPPPATPGGFGSSGGFGQAPSSSPFGAPATPATPGGSGALFTIGSAPAPAPGAGGARQFKKLPNRRGGAKR